MRLILPLLFNLFVLELGVADNAVYVYLCNQECRRGLIMVKICCLLQGYLRDGYCQMIGYEPYAFRYTKAATNMPTTKFPTTQMPTTEISTTELPITEGILAGKSKQ